MNKWMKKLTAALCAAVLMCGMAVTAYAGGGEEWNGLDPVEPLPMETVDPGEGFTEDGNLVTRDLLYDRPPISSSSRCRPAAATPFTSSLTMTSPPMRTASSITPTF